MNDELKEYQELMFHHCVVPFHDGIHLLPCHTEEVRKHSQFMSNPDNIMNCYECPMNSGFSGWGGNKPCGQQNCWISIFTEDDDEDNDNED